MDLLKDFNFVIIHIFRKTLVLLINHLNYLKDNITMEKNIITGIRNLSRLKKEIKGINDIVLRNIKNLFEFEKNEENY